ncbi:MAG TPA: hypothetical protein VGW10_17585 [Solirubrobacteraceae bacterium]|nr:hypothetical protein [Solirubrobacteraceae bacterium]
MIRLRLAAAVPLAALAIAGCGGDDKPSKEEFATNAEKVCADLEKQSQELSQNEPENVQEIVDFTKKARTTAEDAVKRIRELELPEGADGDKAKQWQDAVTKEAEGQLIPALDKLEQAAEANDEKAIVEAAQEIQQIEATESDKLAKDIGAEGCAD